MESALLPVSAVAAQRAAELAAEERERYAMRAAHLESHMAQRMFLEDMMLPQSGAPITYERMYTLRHNALLESHESKQTVHRLLQRGRVSRAMQVAEEVLGGVSDEAEEAEEESLDNDEAVSDTTAPVQDILVEDVQAALLAQITQQPPAAAPVQAYSGRCFRLDN